MKPVFPPAALAQHIAVLGKNGSGKTYATKAVIVEPLLAAGKRVAIVDPTSAWWGLRSSADGRGPGFKVLVLGGDHGDLPLPALGGAAVARLVVEQGVNLIADTGNFTVGERTRWMIDFAGTLYRLNRAPLHLVIDECHVFAPQGKVPDPDTGKMLHAVNQIAAGGRSRGIRLTMLTQRPQKLHKDTLTTADTLIAMRVLAPQDREAVKAWIDGCGDPAQGKEILGSLAQMKRGEGWVWYPEGGVLTRVMFPRITTFDSSATPKDGDTPPAPKGAAEIDLSEIRAALADAVKEAEENDPKLLKRRISELERAAKTFATRPIMPHVTNQDVAEAETRGYTDGYKAGVEDSFQNFEQWTSTKAGDLHKLVDSITAQPPMPTARGQRRSSVPASVRVAEPRRAPAPAPRSNGADRETGLTGPEQRIVDAIAWLAATNGREDQLATAVAFLAGYTFGGGGFNNPRSSLRTKGHVEYAGDRLRLTDSGRAVARQPRDALTTDELHRRVLDILPGPEQRILKPILEAYPDAVDGEDVARVANYAYGSGGFNNPRSRLRTLGLIEYVGKSLRASDALFP